MDSTNRVGNAQGAEKPWRKVSGDRTCESWRNQTNVMTALAIVYSYVASLLTLEAAKGLHENPTQALIRCLSQVQVEGGCSDGSTGMATTMTDHGTPVLPPFEASPAALFTTFLFFTGLGLSLMTLVLSLLCKLRLHEYEQCDTPIEKEKCLASGLPFPGLRTRRVPNVIAFLPMLLLGVAVLFMIGIHILLWSVNTLVGSLVTVGEVIIVLGVVVAFCLMLMRG